MVCAVEQAMRVFSKKWTIQVLAEVYRGNHHFGAIGRRLRISDKVLAERLRELEAVRVLVRKVDAAQTPPAVAYQFTREGRELVPILRELHDWVTVHALSPPVSLTE